MPLFKNGQEITTIYKNGQAITSLYRNNQLITLGGGVAPPVAVDFTFTNFQIINVGQNALTVTYDYSATGNPTIGTNTFAQEWFPLGYFYPGTGITEAQMETDVLTAAADRVGGGIAGGVLPSTNPGSASQSTGATTLTAGTTYTVRIFAISEDTDGNVLFDWSAPMTVTTLSAAVPVDGTADWGAYTNFGNPTGQTTTFTYGAFSAFSPAANTIAYGQTFEQQRSRTTTENVSAGMQEQRRTCNQLTAPSNGGSVGTCSMPTGAIGDTDSRTLTLAATSTSVTPTVANGGVERQNAVGSNWASTDAVVGLGNLAIDRLTGIGSGNPSVSNARFISRTFVGAPYDLIAAGDPAIVRTVDVVVQAPADANDPNEQATIQLMVTQASSGFSDFLAANLNVTCSGTLDGGGATAAAAANRLRADHVGTLSVTSGAVPANPSATASRDVTITWQWVGNIPAGFIDAGSGTTLTGTVTCQQGANVPTAATSGSFAETFFSVGPDERHQVSVTTNGAWGITESGAAGIVVSASGTANANGFISITTSPTSQGRTKTVTLTDPDGAAIGTNTLTIDVDV